MAVERDDNHFFDESSPLASVWAYDRGFNRALDQVICRLNRLLANYAVEDSSDVKRAKIREIFALKTALAAMKKIST